MSRTSDATPAPASNEQQAVLSWAAENHRRLRAQAFKRQALQESSFHNCFMSRRPIFLTLLLAMLLQAVSLGGHWAGAGAHGPTRDALHALLHWAGSAHHHDHHATQRMEGFEAFADELATATLSMDQSWHQDQSADSHLHMDMDACLSMMGPIPASVSSPWIPPASPRPLPSAEAALAGPVLEGLKRPPKSLA
jgi:hypothetical protein